MTTPTASCGSEAHRLRRLTPLLVFLLGLLALGVPAANSEPDWGSEADALQAAIRSHLMSPEGGVYSYLGPGRQEHPDVAGVGHERLSESAGLLLANAVAAEDRALSALVVAHYRRYFRSTERLTHWKLDPSDRPVRSSDGRYSAAPIDDLRLIRSLLASSSVFKERSHGSDARQLAKALRAALRDGFLTDDVSWDPGPPTAGTTVVLSYLDVAGMRLAADTEREWGVAADRALDLLRRGTETPALPWDSYDPASGAFHCPGQCLTTLGLLTALHLAEVDETEIAKRIERFCLERIESDGKLSNGYAVDGQASGAEELAAYALLARLAWRLGDRDAAVKILHDRVLPHRITGETGDGLFSYSREDGSAFDNLQILLTFRELQGRRLPAD